MKKTLLIALFLVLFLVPVLVSAQAPFVRCGNSGQKCCSICDLFATLGYIYNFLVLSIATPLAILGVLIGAVLIMVSAGNPQMLGLGKKIFYGAIIGMVLVFCSWLIINTLLSAIGFNMGTWWNPSLSCPSSCVVP
jgi:hypothetical protein